jgi:hypothetical protein
MNDQSPSTTAEPLLSCDGSGDMSPTIGIPSSLRESGNLTIPSEKSFEPKRRPPGIYCDVPFDEYREWSGINQSSLKIAMRSLAHYRHAKDNPEPSDKDCFRFGQLCHAGRLEPVTVLERYVLMPAYETQLTGSYEKPKASKEYKDLVRQFQEVNSDKEIVPYDWYMQLCGILRALDANSRARAYLSGDGPAEVSIVWDDEVTGLRCKARLDKWDQTNNTIPDIKTTIDASDFEWTCRKFRYDVQGAFYVDGLRTLTGIDHDFCLIAVEKNAPFGCRSAPLSDEALDAGRLTYRRILRRIKAAQDYDIWPGYTDPDEWDVPAPSIDLSQGGKPFFTL